MHPSVWGVRQGSEWQDSKNGAIGTDVSKTRKMSVVKRRSISTCGGKTLLRRSRDRFVSLSRHKIPPHQDNEASRVNPRENERSMFAPTPRTEPTKGRFQTRLTRSPVLPLTSMMVVAAAAVLCGVRADTAEERRPTSSISSPWTSNPTADVRPTDPRRVMQPGVSFASDVRSGQAADHGHEYPAPLPPETRYVPDRAPRMARSERWRPERGPVDFAGYQGPSLDYSHLGFTNPDAAASSGIAAENRIASQTIQAPPGAADPRNVPANLMAQPSGRPDPSIRSDQTVKIPLAGALPPGAVSVDQVSGQVTVVVRDTPLGDVLSALAIQRGLNLITSESISSQVSVTLQQVPFEEALTQILAVAGYTWIRQGDILIVTNLAASSNLAPHVQGREVRVFQLDYVAAVDVDLVIKGLLSPVGQSFLSESVETDNRRTQELVVVEDVPAYLSRIEEFIRQVDIPPRQVLIEVHILAVELDDDLKYGLNLEYLDKITPSLTLRTQGFADAATFTKAASPAFFFNLAGGDLNVLLEALETTTDAKALATPKVLALNGQQARIQVGGRLGYRITTTTQTSSLQSVDFLDVGVVLTVTPRISADGSVLMEVSPQVSTGEINLITQLPEEETTQVETSIMLPDGHGMLIGGLIQESDSDTQGKIPFVGDLWLVGRLFQQSNKKRKRTEIVIALIPHVVPYGPERQQMECAQFERATTPLTYGPLRQAPRPHEPKFPDASQRMSLHQKAHRLRNLPDNGGWAPDLRPQRCAPGYMTPLSPDGVPREFIRPGEHYQEAPPAQWEADMIPTPQPEFVN